MEKWMVQFSAPFLSALFLTIAVLTDVAGDEATQANFLALDDSYALLDSKLTELRTIC